MPQETKPYLIEYSYMSKSTYSRMIKADSLKECIITFATEYVDGDDNVLLNKALVGCDDDKSIIEMFNVFRKGKQQINAVYTVNEVVYER